MFCFDLKQLSLTNQLNLPKTCPKSERPRFTGTVLSSLVEKTIRKHVPNIQITSAGSLPSGNYSLYTHDDGSIRISTRHAPRGVRFELDLKKIPANHPLAKKLLEIVKKYDGQPVTTHEQPE